MRVGAVLLIAGSLCLAFVGVFTVDFILLHTLVALGFFILTPLGFLFIGLSTKDGKIRKLSLASGISALLAILVLPLIILVFSFRAGFAIPELVEALAISAWTIYMAAKMYGNA